MSKILYEVSFKIELAYVTAIIFLIIAVVIAVLMKKGKIIFKNQDSEKYGELIKAFGVMWVVCAFIMSGVILLPGIYSDTKMIGLYKRGSYQIVEGYVENFEPMPYGGHKDESFEINGIKFFYSNYNLNHGYHNAKSHGGVITGDGQHLKVGYIHGYKASGNVIVYIEALP